MYILTSILATIIFGMLTHGGVRLSKGKYVVALFCLFLSWGLVSMRVAHNIAEGIPFKFFGY